MTYLVYVTSERGPVAQKWTHAPSDMTDGYWKSRMLMTVQLTDGEARMSIDELVIRHPGPAMQTEA